MEPDRKTQILKTASKRFARHGLNKTTLDEIARDLRIGKATIYHYFNSKDSLFYLTIEYDASLFLEDIRQIFNKEDLTYKERLAEYYNYKQEINIKYKLLYDLAIRIFKDEGLEKEVEILKNLLHNEEEIIKLSLNNIYNGRIELLNPELPQFFVMQTWGNLFGKKLSDLRSNGMQENSKEIFLIGLDNILKIK